MTVDALVAWPLSTTLNASLLHMPAVTGAGAVDGAGLPYPIRRGTTANCAGDADVMYSGGEAALPMLSKARQTETRAGGPGSAVSNDRRIDRAPLQVATRLYCATVLKRRRRKNKKGEEAAGYAIFLTPNGMGPASKGKNMLCSLQASAAAASPPERRPRRALWAKRSRAEADNVRNK